MTRAPSREHVNSLGRMSVPAGKQWVGGVLLEVLVIYLLTHTIPVCATRTLQPLV
jgi:hypothetical protein